MPRAAGRVGAQLVHSLSSAAPLWGPQVRITTIHDLNFVVIPGAHFGMRAWYAHARSRLVIAGDVIDLVPLAAEDPSDKGASEQDPRERFGINDRAVVFSPGVKRPHKNAIALLLALAAIPESERPLVIVSGYQTPYEDELLKKAETTGVSGSLRIGGRLETVDLEGMYAMSSVVAVPSLYEGSGLPVLEAMIRGVPAVADARSSLPEGADDTALLVDPDSPTELVADISMVIGDKAEADRLSRAGLERARLFSWEQIAALTAASYMRSVGSFE